MMIRPARISDAHSMASIYVQTWRDTYLGVVPYGYLAAMSIARHEKDFLRELNSRQVVSFVAENNHQVVGFVTGGYERNWDRIYTGEIYTLYVMKNHQRRGIGAGLVAALARKLEDSGSYSMLVQVLKQNPYRHFYVKINGIHLNTQSMAFAGETLVAETYGWIDSTLVYR